MNLYALILLLFLSIMLEACKCSCDCDKGTIYTTIQIKDKQKDSIIAARQFVLPLYIRESLYDSIEKYTRDYPEHSFQQLDSIMYSDRRQDLKCDEKPGMEYYCNCNK